LFCSATRAVVLKDSCNAVQGRQPRSSAKPTHATATCVFQPIPDGMTCSLSRADLLWHAPCGFVPSMVRDQQPWLITLGINSSCALAGPQPSSAATHQREQAPPPLSLSSSPSVALRSSKSQETH
jgi:hypothetical protein